jgi:subtilisin family serine protease
LVNSIDTSKGKSFPGLLNNPHVDSNGHGTHIAGIIAAKKASTNTTGFNGLNGLVPNSKVVSIKIVNSHGFTTLGHLNNAWEYVSHPINGAKPKDVIMMALGSIKSVNACQSFGNGPVEKLRLLSSNGVFVVMSAGNCKLDPNGVCTGTRNSQENWPGCISGLNIFTIGSIDNSNTTLGGISNFSFFGQPSVDFLSPGNNVLSCHPGNNYVRYSGTSMAAAVFAGLLYSVDEWPSDAIRFQEFVNPLDDKIYQIPVRTP